MGGGSYSDEGRDKKASVFDNTAAHTDLASTKNITTDSKSAVICAIDVTGSMGSWTKFIWEKMPMCYGQILMQGYLDDPSVCFAAVGDHTYDKAPLQVTGFAQGNAIDDGLCKIWLEKGGGSTWEESYELAAYYFARKCTFPKAETKPILFFTGDESFYETIDVKTVKSVMGDDITEKLDSYAIFKELTEKYQVFLLHKPNEVTNCEKQAVAQWTKAIGAPRILNFHDPKACIDIMLGAIALSSKSRTLAEYMSDMTERGQVESRCTEVRAALLPFARTIEGDLPDAKVSAGDSAASGVAALSVSTDLSCPMCSRKFAETEAAALATHAGYCNG